MIKKFVAWLVRPRMSAEESYYSHAVDLSDLESRMENVRRGKAPFQKLIY